VKKDKVTDEVNDDIHEDRSIQDQQEASSVNEEASTSYEEGTNEEDEEEEEQMQEEEKAQQEAMAKAEAEEEKNSIAGIITLLAKDNELTQTEIAKKLGISHPRVSTLIRKIVGKWSNAIASIDENDGIDYSEIIIWA
jgi:predicted XRE-type DNA-binding protein